MIWYLPIALIASTLLIVGVAYVMLANSPFFRGMFTIADQFNHQSQTSEPLTAASSKNVPKQPSTNQTKDAKLGTTNNMPIIKLRKLNVFNDGRFEITMSNSGSMPDILVGIEAEGASYILPNAGRQVIPDEHPQSFTIDTGWSLKKGSQITVMLQMLQSKKIVQTVTVLEGNTSSQTPNVSESSPTESPESNSKPESNVPNYLTLDEYKQYALSLINKDRKNAGLPEVKLDNNEAAQKHAEEMLGTRTLSHWTTDGMKPYMRYSINDGTNYVGQNAASITFSQESIAKCESGEYLCDPVDVEQAIKSEENSMMNDDFDCCANGHRYNILDTHHTSVSLGISYDQYSVFMVQNFENSYFNIQEPITKDNINLSFSGTLSTVDGYEPIYALIYYDEYPTADTYEANIDRHSYDPGAIIASVVPRFQDCSHIGGSIAGSLQSLFGSLLYSGTCTITTSTSYVHIVPDIWSVSNGRLQVNFNISPLILSKGTGVYTVYLFVQPYNKSSSEIFPVTSYSVFVTASQAESIQKSSVQGDKSNSQKTTEPASGYIEITNASLDPNGKNTVTIHNMLPNTCGGANWCNVVIIDSIYVNGKSMKWIGSAPFVILSGSNSSGKDWSHITKSFVNNSESSGTITILGHLKDGNQKIFTELDVN